jgi:hypothetical protein
MGVLHEKVVEKEKREETGNSLQACVSCSPLSSLLFSPTLQEHGMMYDVLFGSW